MLEKFLKPFKAYLLKLKRGNQKEISPKRFPLNHFVPYIDRLPLEFQTHCKYVQWNYSGSAFKKL